MIDLYKTLGVRRNASLSTIRSAYRQKAKAAHPDAPGGSVAAFNALKLAHDILTDPAARAHYNATGEAKDKAADPGRGALLVLIAQVLDSILQKIDADGKNPVTVDIAAALVTVLTKHRDGIEEQIGAAERREASYAAIIKRFRHSKNGENVLAMIAEGQRVCAKQKIAELKRGLALADQALALVKEHNFERQMMQHAVHLAMQQQASSTSSWWS